jgi:zinc protease
LSTGRSSRLYRALVMGGLASSAGAGSGLTRDPYLFRLNATARPDVDPERLEAAALAEVDRLIEDGVTEQELAKVRRQMRAGHLFGTEGVTSQARYLGQYEMAHTWRAFDTYLDDLLAVTAEDAVRVAATYLTAANRTVGWFIPTSPAAAAARPAAAPAGTLGNRVAQGAPAPAAPAAGRPPRAGRGWTR